MKWTHLMHKIEKKLGGLNHQKPHFCLQGLVLQFLINFCWLVLPENMTTSWRWKGSERMTHAHTHTHTHTHTHKHAHSWAYTQTQTKTVYPQCWCKMFCLVLILFESVLSVLASMMSIIFWYFFADGKLMKAPWRLRVGCRVKERTIRVGQTWILAYFLLHH